MRTRQDKKQERRIAAIQRHQSNVADYEKELASLAKKDPTPEVRDRIKFCEQKIKVHRETIKNTEVLL